MLDRSCSLPSNSAPKTAVSELGFIVELWCFQGCKPGVSGAKSIIVLRRKPVPGMKIADLDGVVYRERAQYYYLGTQAV